MSIHCKGIFKIPLSKVEEKKKTLKSVWDKTRPQTPKAHLRKKIKAGGLILPGCKLHNKAIIIKPLIYNDQALILQQ